MRRWLVVLLNAPLLALLLVMLLVMVASPLRASEYQRVVFGSFSTSSAAQSWAAKVAENIDVATEVLPYSSSASQGFRVASQPLTSTRSIKVQRLAEERNWPTWQYVDNPGVQTPLQEELALSPSSSPSQQSLNVVPALSSNATNPTANALRKQTSPPASQFPAAPMDSQVEQQFDLDLGMQSRSYLDSGNAGQDRWQASTSLTLQWQRSWQDGRRSLTATPFLRIDSQDSERTHFDMRELFVSAVGSDWELHVGARRVFWGVTEFHHLVDVINQTDLVENIDMEDKLGQPMVQLSLVRDWGIVDLMLLTGSRERTFPGGDGRLRALLPINTDRATYDSAAQEHRMDGAIRWSHTLAGVDFGVYHFSGTNRDPQLRIVSLGANEFELRPHYTTIDQTGLDAQANLGDWAFKLEAISRSGDGERYAAANLGLERTLVGAFGTRSDLGLVLEYMFDERGDAATNNVFERDLAVGARWQLNDLYDSQALLGAIWDTRSDELIVSLEANRRLGEHWQLALEARVFAGAERPEQHSLLALLADPKQKTAALQRDDFLQLEFTRFF